MANPCRACNTRVTVLFYHHRSAAAAAHLAARVVIGGGARRTCGAGCRSCEEWQWVPMNSSVRKCADRCEKFGVQGGKAAGGRVQRHQRQAAERELYPTSQRPTARAGAGGLPASPPVPARRQAANKAVHARMSRAGANSWEGAQEWADPNDRAELWPMARWSVVNRLVGTRLAGFPPGGEGGTAATRSPPSGSPWPLHLAATLASGLVRVTASGSWIPGQG